MNTQDYDLFWQRIHKSAKDKGFPLRVMFELTYRCNFKCQHCYVPMSYRKRSEVRSQRSEGKELKTKEVFSILNQLADIGCFYLGFTGGEPFLREDIIEILRYARKRGFETIIYTNGSLIDKEIVKELSLLRPNKIDITIPAISKTAFERISGVPGSRNKVFNAIELLRKKRVNLGFKTCVLKENEDEIEDIHKFAESLDALHRLDDMLSARLDGSKEPYRYRGSLKENNHTLHAPRRRLHVSDNNTSQVISEKIIDCNSEDCDKKTGDRRLVTGDLFKCGVGQSQAAITPLGELKMCVMIEYPKYKIRCTSHVSGNTPQLKRDTCYVIPDIYYENYPPSDLKEAWTRLKELVASIRPDKNYKCNKCSLEPYCKWCPAKSWLYNRSFTSCESESRRWAEHRKQLLNC